MNVINAKVRIIKELCKRGYEGSDNNVMTVAKESRSIFDGLIYNLLSNRFDVKYGSKLDFDLRQCNFELRDGALILNIIVLTSQQSWCKNISATAIKKLLCEDISITKEYPFYKAIIEQDDITYLFDFENFPLTK